MKFAVYKMSTGEITGIIDCPPNLVELQVKEGEEFYLNPPPDATHIIDGEPVTVAPPSPPPPTMDEVIAAITNAVQRHLDMTARSRFYDGILSLASYVNSTDPVFAAEAAAGLAWRDAVWRTCYQGLADVQAGLRPMPTPDEAVAELPPMVWPS